jgi:hypothetical protein
VKPSITNRLVLGGCLLLFVVSAFGIAGAAGAPGPVAATSLHHPPTTLPNSTLVSAPPTGAKGPDDITWLASDGLDWGRPLVWTAYQNGVNPDGTAGSPGGTTSSTIAGYDPALGVLVRSISVHGKVDGLTADRSLGQLIATVNEDSHSAMKFIDPATGVSTNYTFSPDPAVSGNGGTDSIAIWGGQIYLVHSNPNDTSQAAEYLVALHHATHIAQLTPVFYDDSSARTVATGTTVGLHLTDPDTSFVMPSASHRFAGDLATISQADGQIVFAAHHGSFVRLHVLNLTDNVSGNVPPIDGFTVATSDHGTLYVVDAKAGTIQALKTAGWPKGTVFVGEPSDSGNPLLGVLNLSTGTISPLGNHFVSPKGLLFVPSQADDDDHHGEHGDHGHHHHDDGSGRDAAARRDQPSLRSAD